MQGQSGCFKCGMDVFAFRGSMTFVAATVPWTRTTRGMMRPRHSSEAMAGSDGGAAQPVDAHAFTWTAVLNSLL